MADEREVNQKEDLMLRAWTLSGEGLSFRAIGNQIGLSRTTVMNYVREVEKARREMAKG